MKKIALISLSIMLLVVIGTQPSSADTKNDSAFVTVKNTHFIRNGKPYYVIGANMWYGGYLGSPGKTGDRARLTHELDNLKALGINNIRLMAVSENSAIASAVKPAVMNHLGEYDEELLTGLDYFMAELAKRDMTAVLYLNNFWQWSGGFSQYLSWLDGVPVQDPNVTHDYPRYMARAAMFYRSAVANEAFRNTIRKLVNRVNTITGKPYNTDPTILSWQLANEPRPGANETTSDEDKKIFIQWIDDTANFIHQLDHQHLVSSGSEGWRGCVDSKPLTIDSNRTAHVDYITFHLWPRNWSWYDQHHAEQTWNNAIKLSHEYLNWHIDLGKQLNKPVVLEEFGLDRDEGSFDIKATTHYRDRFYRDVFQLLYGRAKKGDALAGFNFWAWNGAGRTHNADYWWKPGDDFNGDPPQEQQGMYGVFDSDVSTILVIKEFADQFHTLSMH